MDLIGLNIPFIHVWYLRAEKSEFLENFTDIRISGNLICSDN
jgi:hypothetical protein